MVKGMSNMNEREYRNIEREERQDAKLASYDKRIDTLWIQTSRTGMGFTYFCAEEYFNKITRNNQGDI
jgi:hypothetical protein